MATSSIILQSVQHILFLSIYHSLLILWCGEQTGVKRKKKSALLSNEVPNTVKGIALMMAAPDSGLNIKPRTGFLHVYPDCFVGM